MSVLDKKINDLTENINKLKKLQTIENWFVQHCGELHSINNFHPSYAACIVLTPINGMTDAIDSAMTINPLPMYKVKDGDFTSFKSVGSLDAHKDNELIHPVLCDINHYDKNPKIKFVINSPFGLIQVQREVTGTDIKIVYEAYGRPLKYRRVFVANHEYWFNSFVKYASGSAYAINPFTLYNKT
jgi:hypothetical protein